MDVTEALTTLRSDVPGCSIAAYADLSSGIVLSSSAAVPPAREDLDALAAAATETLDGAVAEGASQSIGEEPPESAIAMSTRDLRVFLRAPGNPSEALICVCAAGSDVAQIVERGRSTLDRIASDG